MAVPRAKLLQFYYYMKSRNKPRCLNLHNHKGISYLYAMGRCFDNGTYAKAMKHNPYELWKAMVRDYSGRLLTNPTDRLAALSGLVSVMQPLMAFEYLAGLWRSDLLADDDDNDDDDDDEFITCCPSQRLYNTALKVHRVLLPTGAKDTPAAGSISSCRYIQKPRPGGIKPTQILFEIYQKGSTLLSLTLPVHNTQSKAIFRTSRPNARLYVYTLSGKSFKILLVRRGV
jgi:hypothetical protein